MIGFDVTRCPGEILFTNFWAELLLATDGRRMAEGDAGG